MMITWLSGLCWHKWSKWEYGRINYIDEKGNVVEQGLGKCKVCEKCGLQDLRKAKE